MPVRVIKLGGSLLDLPDLAARLRAWVAGQPPARNLILVGGGRFVDELRRLDALHGVGNESAHWLALRAMSLTARLLHALLPDWPLITRTEEACGTVAAMQTNGSAAILDPCDFLAAEDAPAAALPHSWKVTSDSIAAHLARQWSGELVLLKSCLPPAASTAEQAASVGYVDAYFPQAARELSVRCVDFRDPECRQRALAIKL